MAVTDYKLSSTVTNETRTDSDDDGWTDVSNVETDDSNYAVNLITKDSYSDWLRTVNFSMGVPVGATIDGIEVQIKHDNASPSSNEITDSALYLRKVTTGQVGDNYADATVWAEGSSETFTYGGATDKWGTTWSAADVNNTAFGLDFSAFADSTAINHIPHIYFVKIRVYYTASGTTINPKVKVSGTFATKTAKTKISGAFTEKPVMIRVGGAFQ